MKISINQKALSAFKKLSAVVLITATVFFVACKQKGGGGGGNEKPTPKPKHAITFSVEGANGTLKAKAEGIDETQDSPISVEEGKEVTFTAEASKGYRVKEWKVDDTVVTGNTSDTYTHTVTKAVTVKVSFESKGTSPTPSTKYMVTLTQMEHGTVTALPAIPQDGKVDKDTEITFTAKANKGYRVDTWVISPSSAIQSGGNKGEATAKLKITANTTVSVSFELIPEAAILTLSPNKLIIGVSAKTADGKPIKVEGCTETTFASDANTELHATGTVVTLKGKITELNCNGNQLTALNVQGLTALEELLCRNNQLTTLDVSGLIALKELGCNSNQLTSLNVSGCTALENLGCFRNQLTSLNVQGLTSLEMLGCHGNQLTTLDISGLTALKRLSCYNNKINAEEMTKLLKAFPAREASDGAKATLYTEKTELVESNCKDFTQPETLKTAFNEAKGKNWKLQKEKPDGAEVDILLTYAITFSVDGGNGKLTAKADGIAETEASPINVEEGKTVTFTATPNDSYSVKGWTLDGSPIAEAGTNTEYTLTVTKPATVKVNFKSPYKQVAYADLATYLANTASATDINYIEVTGLTAEYLKGDVPNVKACPLGQKLNASDKKVALKLPKTVTGLTDMIYSFLKCKNLVSVTEIPSSVTNMNACFKECKSLTTAPVIPSGVTDIRNCFNGCIALTSVMLKCNYRNNFTNIFKDCNALGEKSIKVPQSYYDAYTTAEALNKMAVPGATGEEKKGKFEGI